MKMKSTKKALLTSVLSLLLCCAMLVGTTFAWFTDSVSSGNNIIKSGNLDIELEYWDGDSWEDVEGKSDILTNTLWEPGVTEVAYLRVANAGSLALKYQLGINIVSEMPGVNVAGEAFKLSDYIQFGVVEGVNGKTGAYATREAAVAALEESKKISAGYTKADSMASGEELYLALVVYMPTTVGNVANYKTGTTAPQIDLGINVYATQVEAELDSFGPDYDEDAWMPEMQVYTAQDLQAAVNNGETNIVLMDDIDLSGPIIIPAPAASTFAMRATPAPVVLNLNGKTITTAYNEETQKHQYAIDNYGNLVINGGTIEARGIYNREGASMTVNGTKIVNLDTNGGSCIWSYGGSVVLNDAELIGYTGCVYSDGYLEINGGTYTCYAAILDDGTQLVPTYNIRSNSDLVINGGNFTSRHGLVSVKGTAVINGGTYTMNSIGVITSHVIYVYGDNAQVTVNGGAFNCDLRTAQNNGSSLICVDADDVDVAVNGGTFNLNPAKYLTDSFKAVAVDDGWMVIATNQNYVADGVLVSTDGKTYYISNAAGYAWVDAQTENFFGNKTIQLTANIDFGGATLTPIKFWNSHPTFDGNGYTLSNFVIGNSGYKVGSGLFSGTFDVKNLNVENANVTGDYVGVISGQMYGNIDNCSVKNSVINGSYWQTGALAGQYNAGNVTNCVVDNCTINGQSAVGGLIGILNETAGTRTIENCVVRNTAINQTGSFGANYDNYFGVAVGLINIDNSTVYVNNCTFEDNTLKGAASNKLYGEAASSTRVVVDGATYVATTAELIAAIKNAPVGEVTEILMADGTYAGDIKITLAAMGKQGGDVVIKAAKGANPVITGMVTLGYRAQGVDAAMYNANVTFVGVTFKQAAADTHSIDVQDVKSLTLINCTIINNGEYGITSARGNATGTSKIEDCTFENAGMQLLGNFATGLVIDDCTFNESRINVQAGNGVTVQNCKFNATLTDANVDDSFYMIRSNSTPITVKDCEINIDSTVTGVATAQAKWYLLANRGTTNWTVENVAVTLTEAAQAQTALVVTACTSTGVINATNLTVNGVAK